MTPIDDDIRQEIRDSVTMFRLIWEEVNTQFAEMDLDHRLAVFSEILPAMMDLSDQLEDELILEELREGIEKEIEKRTKKK
jgi:hypothetical protein